MIMNRAFPSSATRVESPGRGRRVLGIRYSSGPDPSRPIRVARPVLRSTT
jgi:hypothetical protein